MWQIIHWEIPLDKVTGTTPTSHICKGHYFTMESVYWFQNIMKNVTIYAWNKDKIRGQKPFKDDTKCIITHIIGPIGPSYEACNLCIDSLGNIYEKSDH